MEPTLLAIDAGTTGVTGVLFDRDLLPLARAYREFPQGFPAPGRVEHEAKDILAALDLVLGELLCRPEAEGTVAIGITNQRETIFALDRVSGSARGPGIVWQDRRTAERCRELRAAGAGDLLRRRTGLLLDPYFSATKIEWMLREDPALRVAAEAGKVVFATVDTLVLRHLCGEPIYRTDPTNASRTLLFDIDRGRWDPELCAMFGLRPDWLPEVVPSVGEPGSSDPARTAGRSIPIRAMAGDQQAALFGQGCFDEGGLKVTFGTGCFLLLNTGRTRRDSDGGLLTTRALARDGSSAFALEGSVFVAGAAVQWLRDQMGFIRESSAIEELAREVADAGGVVFVPAFAGLGAPHWDAGARAAILGLSRGTSRAHFARAVLEAIALQNVELIELLREETGLPIEAMLADGGAARNDLLMQLQADLGGLEVLRPTEVESTARGAAALAGLGSGLWGDPGEAAAFRSERDRFQPSMGGEERARRLAIWREAIERVKTRG